MSLKCAANPLCPSCGCSLLPEYLDIAATPLVRYDGTIYSCKRCKLRFAVTLPIVESIQIPFKESECPKV